MSGELAAALSAEHAAIFAYGLIGSRLSRSAANEARDAEAAHRDRRDALLLLLARENPTPPAGQPSYALPFPLTDAASALRLAVEIEERTAAVWRAAVPATSGPQRTQALDGLTECAVQATRWRRFAGVMPLTVPFPGRTG